MIKAAEALNKALSLGASSILDIGSGSNPFPGSTTVDIKPPADFVGDFMSMSLGQYDLVWCSHVLEHQLNVNFFLKKCISHIGDGGYFAVTVPPMKTDIVGGHLTVWNAGLLLYNIIVAGIDCSQAMVKSYGYNISVIVQKKPIVLPALNYDFGDIALLSDYFPFKAAHGFCGDIEAINW